MQEPQNWIDRYYNPDGLVAIRERRATWTPELNEQYQAKWQQLYADVRSAMSRGVDPGSEEAKTLATRWDGLLADFTQGNTAVAEGLQRLYSDTANWPDDEMAGRLRAGLPEKGIGAYIWSVKHPNWTDRYYSPEGLEAVRERRKAWTAESQAAQDAKWKTLFADVQSALDRGVAPASAEAKGLALRWDTLKEGYLQGNTALAEGLRRLYDDVENWPDDELGRKLRAGLPKAEYVAFLTEVEKAG